MSQNDDGGWGSFGHPRSGGDQVPPQPGNPQGPTQPTSPTDAQNQPNDQPQGPPPGPRPGGPHPDPAWRGPQPPWPPQPGQPFWPPPPDPAFQGGGPPPGQPPWPPARGAPGAPGGHPVNRFIPPPKAPAKKPSFMSWPMVILILGLVAIGSCSYNMSTLSDFSVARRSGVSTMIKPGVAVLVIEGEIFDTSWAVEALRSFEDSDKVKALVLRINSPGGAVSPCQELYRAIREFTKPVVVSMGSVAASGGLYLAVAGNHILANPGTITGSIGVIMETIEFDEAMDKLGIKAQVIKSGQFKDMGSPFRPMRPEERELLQNMVLEVYEQFVADVAAGRPKLKVERIRAIADGRVFTGEEALKQGLIDGYGGLNDAVLKAAELGKIAKPADAEIVYEDGRSSLVEELLGTRLGFLDKVDSGIQGGTTMKFIYRPGLF